MLVVKASDVKADYTSGPMQGEGVSFRQLLISDKAPGSGGYSCAIVNFNPGARLAFHTHPAEQVIYCTEGAGVIATEDKEYSMTPGTVIIIPPGVKHYHGATANTPFTHFAVFKG
jgi:quercetin dioxygenase-like cupin family protein